MVNCPRAYSEPCQTSKMNLFAQIVNGIHPFTIFAKSSILEVRLVSECAHCLAKNVLHNDSDNWNQRISAKYFA